MGGSARKIGAVLDVVPCIAIGAGPAGETRSEDATAGAGGAASAGGTWAEGCA